MANPNLTPPERLYRGTTIPAAELSEAILHTDLAPGSEPLIDEQGRRVDASGNEHGVYMSDNPHMVEVSYATPRSGDDLPDTPVFSLRSQSHARVQAPRVGVLYAVDPSGLDVRKPFLSAAMQGVHNNGFEGNEWIADVVPSDNHRATRLRVGADLLHPEKVFDVNDDPQETLAEVAAEIAARTGRLAVASARLGALPEHQRFNAWAVESVLDEIRQAGGNPKGN